MRIIVLNDGETYSALEGVSWYHVPDNWTPEDIEQALYAADLRTDDDNGMTLIGWFDHIGAIHIA